MNKKNDFYKLPVYSQRQRILDSLEKNQVVIVESPTGSGKTTQLPIILHEAGYAEKGVIGITQPRRIAAVSVCKFIAGQLDCKVGGYVGYKMRFEDETSHETKLKILTDGTLLQEMKSDRWLSRYSVIMIDEAHERTLNIDFILGLLKEILPNRPDLKVIISSATLNPEVFRNFFNGAPIVSIDTPVYPVKVYYTPPPVENNEEILISYIVSTVEKIMHENAGDILIFCTGEKMIKDTVSRLYRSSVKSELYILPLYGRLGSSEQEKVFDPPPRGLTKVVVSTNVAETSVTIDGISAVIDTGLAKMNYYNPKTFTSALVEKKISRASADQRKGRAGRTKPGICYRLYSEESYKSREKFTREEIYRTDLAEVILRMAELEIKDFQSFPFISPPSNEGIRGAVEALRLLDAIDSTNSLTETGRKMVPYPLMPRHARMIVEAITRYPDVLKEVIITAAFLSTNSPFLLPQGEEMEARKAHHSFRSEKFGDFASYLNLYWDYFDAKNKDKFSEHYYLDKKIMDEILAITEQLEEITSQSGIPVSEGGKTENFIKACARGLIPFVCVKEGRFNYRSAGADKIVIHPGSVLFRENPDFIVAGEIVQTSRIYARSVSPLKKSWLAEIHPDLPGKLLNAHSPAGRTKKEDSTRRKDTTGKIWIGGTSFEISNSPGKGSRKLVNLEWKTLSKALKNETAAVDFGSLRGSLFLNRQLIMENSKINTIIKMASSLNPSTDIINFAPKHNFSIFNEKQADNLIKELENLLKITLPPSGGKKSKKKKAGFTALFSDGKGNFWFKPIKSFSGAVSESLESLEELADYAGKELSGKQIKILNKIYRKLENLL